MRLGHAIYRFKGLLTVFVLQPHLPHQRPELADLGHNRIHDLHEVLLSLRGERGGGFGSSTQHLMS